MEEIDTRVLPSSSGDTEAEISSTSLHTWYAWWGTENEAELSCPNRAQQRGPIHTRAHTRTLTKTHPDSCTISPAQSEFCQQSLCRYIQAWSSLVLGSFGLSIMKPEFCIWRYFSQVNHVLVFMYIKLLFYSQGNKKCPIWRQWSESA